MRSRSDLLTALDGAIVPCVTLLVGIGAVMLYSTTAPLTAEETIPPHFLRQLGAVFVALAVAFLALLLPIPWWRRLAVPFWAASVVLLLLTAFIGIEVHSARRWLWLPGVGPFQPGEVAKIATLLALATVLANRPGRGQLSPSQLAWPTCLVCLPVLLLALQPDLGNAVVLAVLAGVLVFVAGAPVRFFAVPGLVGSAAVSLFILLHPYALRRITGFLNPWETASDEGFQLVQSFVAFGSGGLLGRGLGDGRQKLYYLPEAHTDFILSALAEELGLIGVLFVLGAFATLLVAGLRIAARARNPFALLVGVAMTTLLCVPAAVNAAVVMGALPTKGLTLPFLSYGRTSLVVCFLAVGILLGVSRSSAPGRRRAGSRKASTR